MKGQPLTLSGDKVEIGQKVPDFEVTANDLSKVKFTSFGNKLRVILSLPSLDTSVCDVMARRFNQEAARLGKNVVVLTISMDLPFAQKRWCGNAKADNIIVLSDYFDASFGKAFGVLIEELRLLARAVFVVDKDGVLKYYGIVPELTNEPDYESALGTVRKLLR
jgi:thiol peroxidase